MDESFETVRFSENLTNVIFIDNEVDAVMDSVIGPDETPDIKTGFSYSKKRI